MKIQAPHLLFIAAALLLPSLAKAETFPILTATDSTAIDTGTAPNPKVDVMPAYPISYKPATVDDIKAVLDRVLGYLNAETPVRVEDLDTRQRVYDLNKLPDNPGLDPTEYYLTSYEWGVTYSGMLLSADALGDARYRDYVTEHLAAIAAVTAKQRLRTAELANAGRPPLATLSRLVTPGTMDDCGSICASIIKAVRAGIYPDALKPIIDSSMELITERQMRLDDGTLARKRPFPHTLWLDDLYMSVPALAQMGALTGDHRYWDDAILQVNHFTQRMFIPEKGLFMHGWAQEMDPHPAFCWARANGWAVAAMAELLSVLPDNYPGRDSVLQIYRDHVRGLAACQDKDGLWHQLLDRNDTYLETSASALYVYAIARGVNRGWLNLFNYGPVISLGWNAVAKQVNDQGQIARMFASARGWLSIPCFMPAVRAVFGLRMALGPCCWPGRRWRHSAKGWERIKTRKDWAPPRG